MHALELEQALDAGVRAGVCWCRAVQGRDVFGAGLLDTAVSLPWSPSPPAITIPPSCATWHVGCMQGSLEGAYRVCHGVMAAPSSSRPCTCA